jgi:acyl-CoA dehydrogenase
MSEMREEMLRTLDRLVEETLTTPIREAAEAETSDAADAAVQPLWSALEEAGFLAVAGAGGDADVSFADAMALVRRSAYHALPLPLAETIIARWLAGHCGLALPDGAVGIVVATPRPPLRLAGHGSASSADNIAVARRSGAPVLVAGVGDDGSEQIALLDIGSAPAMRSRNIAGEQRETFPLAPPHGGQKLLAQAPCQTATADVLAAGALLRSVQMAGALDRSLEHCLLWANDRVQFGRPIARFQAIQHQLAVLASETAAAGAAVDQAVEAAADGPDFATIAIAKARTGEAAGKAANIAHAVFGAMGFTREHSLHYVTRRLWAWRNEFGGEAHWQAELGRAVAARGRDGLWAWLTAER